MKVGRRGGRGGGGGAESASADFIHRTYLFKQYPPYFTIFSNIYQKIHFQLSFKGRRGCVFEVTTFSTDIFLNWFFWIWRLSLIKSLVYHPIQLKIAMRAAGFFKNFLHFLVCPSPAAAKFKAIKQSIS